MKLGEIAGIIDGKLTGDPEIVITGVASADEAKRGDITWVFQSRYQKWLKRTSASCVILTEGTDMGSVAANTASIRVPDPSLALARLLKEFRPELPCVNGMSSQSHVDAAAKIGKRVSIGAFCHVGSGTTIGDDVILFPTVYVGNNVRIGDRTHVYPHVSILDNVIVGSNVRIYSGAVMGSEGFSYTKSGGKHLHIPHCGGVIIEDNVEIGALSAIARAVVGNTVIKRGTKIDNLVQVAHNVEIGEDSLVVAQVGIAGSVRIGKDVVVAGQAGITDHAVIGKNAIIGARSAVTKDVAPGAIVCGYPASPRRQSNLAYSLLIKLPELFKRVNALEKRCRQQ